MGFNSQAPVNFISLKKNFFFCELLLSINCLSKILVYIGFNVKRVGLVAHFLDFVFFLIENGNADSHPG